ncbi:hypothetical protein JCM3766R1_004531 [Sporobolomyces carnicolor]
MLLYSTLIVSLVGTALAIPATFSLERRHPALAVTDAFAARLEKRQSSGDAAAVSSLQDLLQKAILSTSTNGQCSSECSSWVSAVTDCTNLDSFLQIGTCACGDTPLSAMNTCGDCFGSDSEQDASNFATFCKDNLGAISSISSRVASRTSPGSSSSATSAGGSESTSRASTTNGNSSPVSSATSQGAPSQSPGSGAGTVKVGMGVLAGALGIALMA